MNSCGGDQCGAGHPHMDGLGSVRHYTYTGGQLTYTESYAPYGQTTEQSGGDWAFYGFTGQEKDYSGNYNLRARIYDPDLGIFLSRDPFPGSLTSPASQNGYGYVHGNPANFTDPTGMMLDCNWLCKLFGKHKSKPSSNPQNVGPYNCIKGECPSLNEWGDTNVLLAWAGVYHSILDSTAQLIVDGVNFTPGTYNALK